MVLHDELGFTGWMTWNRELSRDRQLKIPLQPGFGKTERVEWLQNYRDLAAFYARMVRTQNWRPIDVIGFSAGAFIAAEMAAACPELFRRLVLVASLGLRPRQGEIFDFLAVTMRTHLAATVYKRDAAECSEIYGGEIDAEQWKLFEAARAETSRLGWEPFMFDPSLPNRLEGLGELETLLVWGAQDQITPKGLLDVYEESIPNSRVATIDGVGHRPEIENPARFVEIVREHLDIPEVSSAAQGEGNK
jgi:pimeloyl-ACP methyl ester carboxylesterase